MFCAGCERFELSPLAWRDLPGALRASPGLDFIGLWADASHVHALFGAAEPIIASVPVEAGLYGTLSAARPGAALFERAVFDLWGYQAADAADTRPWLDHGAWPALHPLNPRPTPNAGAPDLPEMLAAPSGDVLALGPLPPNLLDAPALWRVTVARGVAAQVEARGGYGHRGVLGAMRGKSPATAAPVAARIAGAATVAHSTAFARAVEAALGLAIPPRAAAIRTLLAAVERVAVSLHDIAAVAEALARPQPRLAMAREGLLAASAAALGHRLMMDAVRPGGTGPLDDGGATQLDAALEAVPGLSDAWPSGLGHLDVGDALLWGVPGPAGRASGRQDPATPGGAVGAAGDLRTRMRLRAAALAADVALARETLAVLPGGPVAVPLPIGSGEALGFAKGPQGRVWHWVRLGGGVLSATFAIDPAWLHLPAFERAGQGADPALLPAIAGSFGLHLPGMEL